MIIIVKPGAEPAQVQDLVEFVHARGLKTSVVTGTEKVIIGVIGDTRKSFHLLKKGHASR